MDRREVDDVEAEVGEPRQHLLDALEPAPRTWEQLVPRAHAGSFPVDVDLEHRPFRYLRAVLGRIRQSLLDGDRFDLEERGAFRELAAQVLLARLHLPLELVAPRRGAIDPGLDRELPAAERDRLEHAAPAIGLVVLHRRLPPRASAHGPVLDGGLEDVMAVPEDVRPD